MNSEQSYLSCEHSYFCNEIELLFWPFLLTYSLSVLWVDKTDVRTKFTGKCHGENEEDNVLWEKQTHTQKCPAAKW